MRVVVRLFVLVWPFVVLSQTATPDFQTLAAQASKSREANDLGQAITLYQRALAANPNWEEGWWSLGSIFYDANQYPLAADALSHLVALNAKAAPAWGLLGLCQFESALYPQSLENIQRALQLGFTGENQMEGVLRFHEALLLAHQGQFDSAVQKYAWFVQRGVHHDALLLALGLAALRRPIFPEANPPVQRDLTLAVGKAAYLSLAGQPAESLRAFQTLAETYPASAGIHYLYATLLLMGDPEKGREEMNRELSVAPENGAANATVAWLLMEEGSGVEAQPYAKKSVEEEPKLPLAQYVYGRSLVEQGKVSEGIQHLEIARNMAPDVLIHHVALAAAYSKAGLPRQARSERELAMSMAREQHAPAAP